MAKAKSKLNILITAGGTREYIDPVRFITNASSGRMGIALARAAIAAGHKVTLILAPAAVNPLKAAKLIPAETCAQMFSAVKNHLPQCDVLIMAAAVSDYTPAKPSKTKLKKQPADLTLKLKPTPDILAWAGKHKKPNQKIIGFALEDKNLKPNAKNKLQTKHLDMIIANPPAAIDADRSTVHIKTPKTGWQTITDKPKSAIARKIITLIQNTLLA